MCYDIALLSLENVQELLKMQIFKNEFKGAVFVYISQLGSTSSTISFYILICCDQHHET